MDFSVIVITRNEEKNLPRLLRCIKNQTLQPKEVIVADADSKDRTRYIAKQFGCLIAPGGDSPGEGRNLGARNAKSDMLVFLDADILLPRNLFRNSIYYMKKKKLEVAAVNLAPYPYSIIDKAMLEAYNIYQNVMQGFWPHSTGACIFCKRKVFDRVNGFDLKVVLAEDMDFVRRAAKKGKFAIIPRQKIYYSMRRYHNDGRLAMIRNIVFTEIYRMMYGEVKNKRIKDKILKYEDRKDWVKRAKRI